MNTECCNLDLVPTERNRHGLFGMVTGLVINPRIGHYVIELLCAEENLDVRKSEIPIPTDLATRLVSEFQASLQCWVLGIGRRCRMLLIFPREVLKGIGISVSDPVVKESTECWRTENECI